MAWAFVDVLHEDASLMKECRPPLRDLVRLSTYGQAELNVNPAVPVSLSETEAVPLEDARQMRRNRLANFTNSVVLSCQTIENWGPGRIQRVPVIYPEYPNFWDNEILGRTPSDVPRRDTHLRRELLRACGWNRVGARSANAAGN